MVSGVRISDGSPKECYPNFSFLMVFSGTQENTDRDKSLPVFFYFKKSLSRTLLTTSSIVGHVVLYIFKHTPDVPSMRNTFQWFFFSSTVNSFPFLTIYNDIASYNIFHIIVQCHKKVNTKIKGLSKQPPNLYFKYSAAAYPIKSLPPWLTIMQSQVYPSVLQIASCTTCTVVSLGM